MGYDTEKSMSNRKSNQLSCLQPSAANTRWLVPMIPAHSLKTTKSSHSAQCGRHQTCPEEFLFPRTILHWNSLSPSVANTRSTEEFMHQSIVSTAPPTYWDNGEIAGLWSRASTFLLSPQCGGYNIGTSAPLRFSVV